MCATGIVGQARCDSGARMAVLGWCARGVSWEKSGLKNGRCGMRSDVGRNSDRPSHAQNVE